MKVTYNGQEVELITEGYWPEGVTLICGYDGVTWLEEKVFFLRDGHAIFDGKEKGTCWTHYTYWALLPAKIAHRRLTNREVAKLCRAGWDACVCGTVSGAPEYSVHDENREAEDTVLRAPNSDEWIEPTSELLEVEA